MAGRCRKKIMSTSIINHLTWFQDINLAAAKSTLISRNQVYLQCILPPRVHLQWLIHSQGAVMHMPVNKPNVNCTYDSSHGTDEIYPKGPPHIYIYIYVCVLMMGTPDQIRNGSPRSAPCSTSAPSLRWRLRGGPSPALPLDLATRWLVAGGFVQELEKNTEKIRAMATSLRH